MNNNNKMRSPLRVRTTTRNIIIGLIVIRGG